MADLNSSLGNVITRLQGLKNVSGRKRLIPKPSAIEGMQPEEMDVEGTSQSVPLPSSSSNNMPQSDMGGELTPQSYDVRANVANNQTEEDPGFWNKIGQALADYVSPSKRQETSEYNQNLINRISSKSAAQTPPIATKQVDVEEGLPPVSASQQLTSQPPQPSPGVFGAIGDYLNPTKRDQMSAYNRDLIKDSQLRIQGTNLEDQLTQQNQNFQSEIDQAIQNQGQYAVNGAANAVASNPTLQAQFRQITGMDYEPQIAAQVSSYEQAMKGVEDALNGINTDLDATAQGIKDRILNNQSNAADNFYIGLALLMPLIVGGIFGKEAGIGALAGASQGFANVLGNRQKSIREDEQTLMDLSKDKASNQQKLAEIGLSKAELGQSLRKNLPEDSNSHLFGMQEATWTDPQTGEQFTGVRIKPGLIARPEFVSSKEGLADMRKAANELSETKTYVDEVNDLTDDVVQIVSQLDDPSNAWKGFTQILTSKSPSALSQLSQDVIFDGRKQNAGLLLEEKLGFLANKYGMAQQLGQLDRAAQAHIKKIIENPTNSFISPQDSLNQILAIRQLAQRGLISNASNKGFYPEFVWSDLESANSQLASRMNQNEQNREIAEIERKLSQ